MQAGWVAGDYGCEVSPALLINDGLGNLLTKTGTSGTPSRVPPRMSAKTVIHSRKPAAPICRVTSLSGDQGARALPAGV